MILSRSLVGLLILLSVSAVQGAERKPQHSASLPQQLRDLLRQKHRSQRADKSAPFGELLDKGLSLLLGQKNAVNEEITKRYKEFAWGDNSNEDIGGASAQEIIARSGYNYENHYAVSPDGYITQLVRLVNPLAERAYLKQPPVLMFHGGLLDSSVWVWPSAIQHQPEKYPRAEGDRHMTSWNRSMAFTLSNNGYDVWLVGARGSNPSNRGHTKYGPAGPPSAPEAGSRLALEHQPEEEHSATNGNNTDELGRQSRGLFDVAEMSKYWDYSMDELGGLEMPAQIERVLEITGARNVTMVTLSLSTMSSLIALAANPKYEQKVHNFVALGPIINNIGTNNFLRSFQTKLCRSLSTRLGNLIFPEIIFTRAFRDLLMHIGKRRDLRQSIVRALTLIIAGPSPKYQSHLEMSVLGGIFKSVGFKHLKHYCQQVVAGRLQKYDYGLLGNKANYGSIFPPSYDIGGISLARWLVISGANDKLATEKSVRQYMNSLKTPPTKHIRIKHYNHLDLMAAVDMDVHVTLPLLNYMDQFQLPPLSGDDAQRSLSRSLSSAATAGDLERHIPFIETSTIEASVHATTKLGSSAVDGHVKRSRLDASGSFEGAKSLSQAAVTGAPLERKAADNGTTTGGAPNMSESCKLVILTVVLLATSALCQLELSASFKVDTQGENIVDKLFNFGQLPNGEKLNPVDYFFEDVLPPLLGQRPNNENGTRAEFKDYALNDKSNDDAVYLSGQQLITRSGFKYELYDAVADDGYITTVTRLINPLADRAKLRQPPVLMEHGGTIDPTAYLVASSIQHFPEKWPRVPSDGPMRSWNRSLAFVLANNGFDVFLAETRGANDANRRRVKSKVFKSFLEGKNTDKNMTLGENIRLLTEAWDYWSFSQDDIIAHELKSHLDTVLTVTGSKKLHLMTFSLSTPTSLAFLGSRPDYAERIEGYVSMAPIVSGQGVSLFTKLFFETFCPLLPNEIGTLVVTDILLTQPMRELIVLLSRPPEFRYFWAKSILTLGMGASPKYQTMMDLNFVGHLLRRLSFKELKQMCQQMRSNKLQKFDYGPVKNQLLYKQPTPPVYDLSNLKIRDWIIVSAANDALSTPQVVDHLIEIANPKPIARFEAPGFNHADLFAGWENDKYVNFPILRYFEQMSYDTSLKKGDNEGRYRSRARGLDFASILPPEMMPARMVEAGLNVTRKAALSAPSPLSLDAKVIIEEMGKNMRHFMTTFTDGINRMLSGSRGNGDEKTKSRDTSSGGAGNSSKDVDKKDGDNKSDKTSARSADGKSERANDAQLPFTGVMPNLFQGVNQVGGNLGKLMNTSAMMQNFGNLGQVLKIPTLGQQNFGNLGQMLNIPTLGQQGSGKE